MASSGNRPILSDDLKKKKSAFKRIYPCFRKKANELSVLCGNSVGYICYGPEGDLHAWPEPKDHSETTLPQIIAKFNQQNPQKQKKHASNLTDFDHTKNLSVDELKRRLATVKSGLAGIRQKKKEFVKKTASGSSSMSEDRRAVSQLVPAPLPYSPGCSNNGESSTDYSLPPLVSYEDPGHAPLATHDQFQDTFGHDPFQDPLIDSSDHGLFVGSLTDHFGYVEDDDFAGMENQLCLLGSHQFASKP